MAEYANTVADTQAWKALPVPTEAANLVCQSQPIIVTFKANPGPEDGFVLPVGRAIQIKSGDAGKIRPANALGGVAVIEVFG